MVCKYHVPCVREAWAYSNDTFIPIKTNLALKRWEQHFKKLFDKEFLLSLKLYYKQINNLVEPKNESYYLKVLELKNKFLAGLEKVESENRLVFIKTKKAINLKQKKKHVFDNILKKKCSFVPVEISKENVRKDGNTLTKAFLDKKIQNISIKAPLFELISQFIIKGFYHYKWKKPMANISLINLNENEIINYYSQIMHSLINYYCLVDNFVKVKKLLEGLRRSCCLTLAFKYKKPLIWVYTLYSKNVKIKLPNGKVLALPRVEFITNFGSKFLMLNNCSFNLNDIVKKFKFCDNFSFKMLVNLVF